MKKRFKALFAVILAVSVIIGGSTISFARTKKAYGISSKVTPGMYEAFIGTLRAHANETPGTLYSTGIVCSPDDFEMMRESLRHLFLGEQHVAIVLNTTGASNGYIGDYDDIPGKEHTFTAKFSNPAGLPPTIYVGFIPGHDPAAIMAQHDAAAAAMNAGLAGAPAGNREFYEYVSNWVAGRGAYVDNGTDKNHSAYGYVVEGAGVCEAITAAYQYMCWARGKECLFVLSDSGTHSFNAFTIDGVWYAADITEFKNGNVPAVYQAPAALAGMLSEPFFTN